MNGFETVLTVIARVFIGTKSVERKAVMTIVMIQETDW
jgi:hypothetical protein